MPSYHQLFAKRQPALELELGEPLSINGLVGPLRIFQRLNGHRHSTDDALTAWYARQKCPTASRVLDLGAGAGTVGLAVLWGLNAEAKLTCVEAQALSFKLLKANIECNGLSDRVRAIYGDLRTLNLREKFSLITGSPPYFPPNAGVLPQDSQKAYARFELRGNVGDYAQAAGRHLEDGGVFVFCFPYQQKSRGIKLVEDAGFRVAALRDVIPSAAKPPLFSMFTARLNWNCPLEVEPPLIIGTPSGKYLPEMLELQRSRGFGPQGENVIE